MFINNNTIKTIKKFSQEDLLIYILISNLCGGCAFPGIMDFRRQHILTCFSLPVLIFAEVFYQVQDKEKKKKKKNTIIDSIKTKAKKS